MAWAASRCTIHHTTCWAAVPPSCTCTTNKAAKPSRLVCMHYEPCLLHMHAHTISGPPQSYALPLHEVCTFNAGPPMHAACFVCLLHARVASQTAFGGHKCTHSVPSRPNSQTPTRPPGLGAPPTNRVRLDTNGRQLITIHLDGDEASDVINFVLKDDATNTWCVAAWAIRTRPAPSLTRPCLASMQCGGGSWLRGCSG